MSAPDLTCPAIAAEFHRNPLPVPRHWLTDSSVPSPQRGPAFLPRQAPPTIHIENWQAWVADGLGTVAIGELRVTGPELTADEWVARHNIEPNFPAQ